MTTRMVSMPFVLVGRSYTKLGTDRTGTEKKYTAQGQIEQQFGDRPFIVVDAIHSEERRPEFYAAGWMISNATVDGEKGDSELVVIAHGNSMLSAKNAMLKATSDVGWDKLARDL